MDLKTAVFLMAVTVSVIGDCPNTFRATGSVFTPVVAFSVGSIKSFVPTTISRIPMETILYNDGGHFDTTTNTFIAPVTGLYTFYYSASGEEDKRCMIYLYAGNPEVAIARSFDWNVKYGQAGGMVMVKMKRGDKASVWSTGDSGKAFGVHGNQSEPPSTYFMGYLVQKLE